MSQPRFGSSSSSGCGLGPKLWGWVPPVVAFSNPGFRLRTSHGWASLPLGNAKGFHHPSYPPRSLKQRLCRC